MNLKGQLINIYDLPEEKITVIPNIIDTNHFIPLNQIKLSLVSNLNNVDQKKL